MFDDLGLPKHYILDEDGEPLAVPLLVWAEWFERTQRTAERVVLQHRITRRGRIVEERPYRRGVGISVSTVFLGLDHNFHSSGPPVLWESLVFGGLLDGEMLRYTSKLAALEGHAALVERVQAAARAPRKLRKAIIKARAWQPKLGPRERRAVARFEARTARSEA